MVDVERERPANLPSCEVWVLQWAYQWVSPSLSQQAAGWAKQLWLIDGNDGNGQRESKAMATEGTTATQLRQ
jgi:hypothetical protein